MNQGIKTIRFMVIISVAFIVVLATVNEATKARITQNFELEQAKSILYAFNIFPQGVTEDQLPLTSVTADIPWEETELLQVIASRLEPVSIPIPKEMQAAATGSFLEGQTAVDVYVGKNEAGEVIAYGLPLYGKGLWGTIEGIGVIAADLNTMVGIDFTKQVETPGLGARIIQKEYKYFFRNLDLSGFYEQSAIHPPVIMVKQKDQTNLEHSSNSVQAITGATQTSQGVLEMVNSNLALYIPLLQAYQEQR